MPDIWTVQKFKTETSVKRHSRNKLKFVDHYLGEWDGCKNGRSKEQRVKVLRDLGRACMAYLGMQKAKKDRKNNARFGKPSSILLKRIDKTEILAGQVFQRLAAELYEYNKHVRIGMNNTHLGNANRGGLGQGYHHERANFNRYKMNNNLHGVLTEDGGTVNPTGGSFVHEEQHAARNQNYLDMHGMVLNPRQQFLVNKPFDQLTLGEFNELHAFFCNNTVLGTQMQSVHYARKDERVSNFMRVAIDGKLYDGTGKPHGTNEMEAYVLDRYGNLMTASSSLEWGERRGLNDSGRSQLNHSTLVAGTEVICAGTIMINAGNVTFITNNSGHYRPSPQRLSDAIAVLMEEYDLPLTETVTTIEELSNQEVFDGPTPVVTFQDRYPPH